MPSKARCPLPATQGQVVKKGPQRNAALVKIVRYIRITIFALLPPVTQER